MINFNKETYLKTGKNTVALKSRVDAIVDAISVKGYKNLFLIGSGGSYAMFIPFEHYLTTQSHIQAYCLIAAELMATGHNQLSSDSVCILTSSSGTTPETVAAAEYCRSKGATTICISGSYQVPYAKDADYPIINKMDDFSASDSDYLLLYMLVFAFMNKAGDFDDYEDFCKNLSVMPEALISVKEKSDRFCEDFAEKYKDENYHLLIGSGSLWGETYSYGMCVMEEMQWIHTKAVKAAEFFHGTLEIVEKDTSVMLIMGEDNSRDMCERVRHFAAKVTDNLTIFDTKDYELPGINSKYRPLLCPIVMTAILDRLSIQLEAKRGHSLSIRRYYRKMEY